MMAAFEGVESVLSRAVGWPLRVGVAL